MGSIPGWGTKIPHVLHEMAIFFFNFKKRYVYVGGLAEVKGLSCRELAEATWPRMVLAFPTDPHEALEL